jgi:lysophospholipase L1-like esterase
MNILLIGDSILDNAPYVCEENSVSSCLKRVMPNDKITNLAVDGNTTDDVLASIRKVLPAGYDYVIVSIGGNDLLQNESILINPKPTSEKSVFFHRLIDKHERITDLLDKTNKIILTLNLYYPFFDVEIYGDNFILEAGLSINKFNNHIDGQYEDEQIIDLREEIKDKTDFTNTIEPSKTASIKIAELIYHAIDRMEINRLDEPNIH